MKKVSVIMRCAVMLAYVLGLGTLAYGADSNDPFAGDPPAGSSAKDKFSDSDIDNLFGTMQQEEEKKDEAAPKRVLPPFHGTYKVLISRPIYAVYEAETKTKWISALGELYTHYKVASFPRTHVFTMEQISGVLPNSRDYGRRFNKQHYIDAARKLGATHLIYQEYQPQKGGSKTRYVMELYWIQEGATVEKYSVDLIHGEFEGGLNVCLAKIAEAMDPGAKKSPAYGTAVWGKDLKTLEAFGNILADEGKFSRDNALATYVSADRIIQKNAAHVGFHYAGALLAGRAESYAKAVHHMEAVIAKSKDYPALQLRLAEYLRGAERYPEAMKAAETAARNPALKAAASMEMAMIHQGQGNLDRALSEYENIMRDGEADGRLFFRLALLSIQAGRIGESEDYLRRAEASGFALDESEYVDLGEAYSKVNGYEDQAIDFLKRGMGVKQNSEEAWSLIAEIYSRLGNRQLEAEAYVNLFKINMQAHSGKLKTAGEIYEKLGMTDKAKDAYSLYMDRRFYNRDVAMNLARIYYNEKNCKKLHETLKGLDTVQEATQMLAECGIKVRAVDASKTMEAKKLSPVVLSLRIAGATVFAGALTGALVMDLATIPGQLEKYHGYPGNDHGAEVDPDAMNFEKVQNMRKDIESKMFLRNTLYLLSGVGLGGFAVTLFF